MIVNRSRDLHEADCEVGVESHAKIFGTSLAQVVRLIECELQIPPSGLILFPPTMEHSTLMAL